MAAKVAVAREMWEVHMTPIPVIHIAAQSNSHVEEAPPMITTVSARIVVGGERRSALPLQSIASPGFVTR